MEQHRKAALLDFADEDVRIAERDGQVLVAGTVRGTVTLTCNAGGYSLVGNGVVGGEIKEWCFTGTKEAVREELASIYTTEHGSVADVHDHPDEVGDERCSPTG